MRNDRDTAHVLATAQAPEHESLSQAAAGLASRGSSASAQVLSLSLQTSWQSPLPATSWPEKVRLQWPVTAHIYRGRRQLYGMV